MAGKFQDWWYRNIWSPEARALENITIDGYSLDQLLGSSNSVNGRQVNYDGSLTLSAVWRALTLKSGIISMLPFQLYRKTSKGRELVTDHPVSRLLSRRPNQKMTRVVYLDRSVQHLEGWGNHVAVPRFNGIGRVDSIDLIHPKDVECFENRSSVAYKIKGFDRVLTSSEVIHVPNTGDSIWGKSTISKATEDIGAQLDKRDYGSGIVAKGGIPVGLFMPQGKVTAEQRAQMQEAWNKAKFKNRAVAMPFGWDYKQISLPPDDISTLLNGEYDVTTIARWFGTPPQKLFELGRATHNNIEHLGIEFLQDTMNPIARRYEVEYTTKLLGLPSEQDLYLEFNMDAYLRADSVAKAEALSKLIFSGQRTPNEARELDNYDQKEGGDELFMQSGTVPISILKQMLLSKTPAQRKAIQNKVEKQLKEGIDPQLILEGLFNTNGNGKQH